MKSAIGFAALAAIGIAYGQDPAGGGSQTPVKPPPIPTGVVPLPQGPPPTGLQQALPPPAHSLKDALHPLAWSPDLAGVKGYVANQTITIQQAVAIALYTSRDFASAVASLEEAAGRTNEAKSYLVPNITTSGQITEFDAPTTFNIGALLPPSVTGGVTEPPFVVVPQFNPIFTAAFTMPLDVFGTLRSAVDQAHMNQVAAKIDVNRVRNQIAYNVKSAFYNVLRAQAQLAVATENLNNALSRLSDANKNYSAGTTSRFDVITAQRDVADAQQGLITAKAQVTVNLAMLKNTMGLDIGARLNISDAGAVETPPDVLPPAVPLPDATATGQQIAPGNPQPASPTTSTLTIEPVAAPPMNTVSDDFDWGPEYKSLVDEANHTRPEILEAQAQVTANKKGLEYAQRSALPSFSISLADQWTPNATGFTRVNEGIYTLNVGFPIYDGGTARARVQQQQAAIALAETNRRQAADQVQLDVQQAYLALVQARQRVAVANVEVSQARESFRVSRVRYQAGVSQQVGVSPQLELSNAQISLTQAESNQVNALYDYNSARAQLDRAVGRYAFAGFGPGYEKPPALPK